MTSNIFVTNEANKNVYPSHKEIIRCHFRLEHIGLQHVQWLIHMGHLKVQVNSNVVANF